MDLLRALSTFNRIAETGSFSAVARETHSSHSAVTRLIGQLEAHFGVRLFHRTTRSLSLTEDGQELLGHALRVLDATMDMEGALGNHRDAPAGLVRLGLPATGALGPMPAQQSRRGASRTPGGIRHRLPAITIHCRRPPRRALMPRAGGLSLGTHPNLLGLPLAPTSGAAHARGDRLSREAVKIGADADGSRIHERRDRIDRARLTYRAKCLPLQKGEIAV